MTLRTLDYMGNRAWTGFEIKIADNGKSDDARMTMYVAPGLLAKTNDPAYIVYVTTNGDPHVLGYVLDEDLTPAGDPALLMPIWVGVETTSLCEHWLALREHGETAVTLCNTLRYLIPGETLWISPGWTEPTKEEMLDWIERVLDLSPEQAAERYTDWLTPLERELGTEDVA